MIANIKFDKEEYNPGDKVRVVFTIDSSKIPKAVQKLVFFVGSGEKTQVIFNETTYRGTYVHSQNSKELDLINDSTQSIVEETLEYYLPSFTLIPLKYHDLEVYHHAQVRFESDSRKSLRQSPITKDIPYTSIEDKPHNKLLEFEKFGLRVKFKSNIFQSGENAVFTIQQINSTKSKKIRIELWRKATLHTNDKSRSENFRNLILKAKSIDTLPDFFQIPDSIFSTRSGKLYDYSFFLKIIVARNILQNNVIELPIIYFDGNKDQTFITNTCQSCSVKFESESLCPNCGFPTGFRKTNPLSFKKSTILLNFKNFSSFWLSEFERSQGWKSSSFLKDLLNRFL